MSVSPETTIGLRERKKVKLRQTVQQAALRLFVEQGYDETTVEQIAEAAETSTSTFYRYFPTKEDVVFHDEYDPLIEQAFAQRPADEPLMDTVRSATMAVIQAAQIKHEQSTTRLTLMSTIPALLARQALEMRKHFDMFARLLATHTGRQETDYQLRLVTAALSAVQFEAARYWAEEPSRDLVPLIDQALNTVEPAITSLAQPDPKPTTPKRTSNQKR